MMESLKTSHKADFADILQEAINYGFIEDTQLSKLFKIDLVELEEILEDSSVLDNEQWTFMVNKLFKHLKKEAKEYQHLYYAD